MTIITSRDVDAKLWLRVKKDALRQGMTHGEWFNEFVNEKLARKKRS